MLGVRLLYLTRGFIWFSIETTIQPKTETNTPSGGDITTTVTSTPEYLTKTTEATNPEYLTTTTKTSNPEYLTTTTKTTNPEYSTTSSNMASSAVSSSK